MDSRNKKRTYKRSNLIIIAVIFIVISMILEVILMSRINARSANKTTQVLLDQVISSLENNTRSEQDMMASLKEEYILRAKTVSFILDKGTIKETSADALYSFAKMMEIDEINLFDENGVIYGGTNPEYLGLSFNSGDQIAYFKPMLTDKTMSMCQDVTPNTALGRSMMYAITWNETGDRMVQLGIEPKRLLAEFKRNEIHNVIESIPSYDGLDIYVANIDTGVIIGATDDDKVGMRLDDIGFPKQERDLSTTYSCTKTIDGYLSYCKFKQVEDMVVVAVCSTKTNVSSFLSAMGVELVYMLIALAIVVFAIDRWIAAKKAQDEHYAVLESMSGIYYSMHFIDLIEDTAVAFNAQNEVRNIGNENKQYGAVVMMSQVMQNVVDAEFKEAALEFSDLTTIADRMQNKKIITAEFRGNRIGWFRASAIAIDSDEYGKPTRIVFTSRSIDGEKRREERLIKKSFTDELTKTLNRRAYEEDISTYTDNPIEDDFVYISADVNGLKHVNDTLGHAAGDEMIKAAGDCMKICFAPKGKIYRTGGDEFVALLHVSDDELVKIKHDFEELVSNWSGKYVDSLAVSCGYVSKKDVENPNIRDIAILADKRMYEIKRLYYENKGIDRRERRS